jgi:hypothetical protein
LRPERSGGVLRRRAEPRSSCGEGGSTCGHQPTTGASWPEARTRLVWGMEEASAGRLLRAMRLNPVQLLRQRNEALLRPRSMGSRRAPLNLSRNSTASDGSAKQKKECLLQPQPTNGAHRRTPDRCRLCGTSRSRQATCGNIAALPEAQRWFKLENGATHGTRGSPVNYRQGGVRAAAFQDFIRSGRACERLMQRLSRQRRATSGLTHCSNSVLFDHLVGADEQRW